MTTKRIQKLQRITQHDSNRLQSRVTKHIEKNGGDWDGVKEITALLDLAEAFEKLGGNADLKAYRTLFVRPPKEKLAS